MGVIARIIRFFGWLLFIVSLVFFISMIAMFFTVEKDKWVAIPVGVFFVLLAFLGWKIKKFKPKNKRQEKIKIRPDKVNSEMPKTEIQKRIEFMAQNQRSIDDEPDIVDAAMAAVIQQRKQPISKEGGGEYKAAKKKLSNFDPLLELCDEIENIAENNYLPFDPHIPVKIIYSDSDGEITEREIDIIYIAASDFSDDYYIKAFCHLRNENRTFNIKRIQKTIVDGSSVDIIQYLVDSYRNTDKYKQMILSIKTRDLLNSYDTIGYAAKILTYISRIDGIFTRKEKVTIASFIKEIDSGKHDIEIENYIAELAELNPSTTEYKNIVKMTDISEQLIEKAREITGKDPLRQGAFEILFRQYEKHKSKTHAP